MEHICKIYFKNLYSLGDFRHNILLIFACFDKTKLGSSESKKKTNILYQGELSWCARS